MIHYTLDILEIQFEYTHYIHDIFDRIYDYFVPELISQMQQEGPLLACIHTIDDVPTMPTNVDPQIDTYKDLTLAWKPREPDLLHVLLHQDALDETCWSRRPRPPVVLE